MTPEEHVVALAQRADALEAVAVALTAQTGCPAAERLLTKLGYGGRELEAAYEARPTAVVRDQLVNLGEIKRCKLLTLRVPALPEGVQVSDVLIGPAGVVRLKLWHPSFPATPEGGRYPEYEP